ncbi:MAG: endonuclease/exonuclease/phosphatase family protein [Flavobacteriales bacterium]|nr:endonuclease/exonuclease/phosphatase family protein [Flavobacteriales bacterium]
MWWANMALAVLLLATYLAPRTPPVVFWPLALLAFAYPYQLVLHAALIVFWAMVRWRRAWLSLATVLIGWGHVGDHFQLFGRDEPPATVTGTPVKLLSWNVRLFDLYNWTHNEESRQAIFRKLEAENAGILCLQEFHENTADRTFRTKSALVEDLGYAHHHDRYSQHTRERHHFGIATFSRHPIVGRGHIELPENPDNQCIWSDIAIGPDTVRVYNAHLASYHFGDGDRAFIAGLSTDMDRTVLEQGGRRILKLLRKALRSRSREIGSIVRHIRASPHPVVYCGDLNDVPMSYSYRQLRLLLHDAFRGSGSGTGGTYIGELPRMRIDHVLHDDRVTSWGFVTHPEEASDHRAVSCWMALR